MLGYFVGKCGKKCGVIVMFLKWDYIIYIILMI